MPDARDIIAPGRVIGGRQLRDAILSARTVPYGGRDVNVREAGRGVIVTKSGEDAHRRIQFDLVVGSGVPEGDGTQGQWRYPFFEVIKKGKGYGAGWAPKLNGKTDAVYGLAYNYLENSNNGAGIEGHGVNVDDLPGTMDTQPIPNGVVCPAWVVPVHEVIDDEATLTYEVWFMGPNGVDGDCE